MSTTIIDRTAAIAIAAEYLGAKPYGSADAEEWSYYCDETQSTWVHPGDDLEGLGRRLIAGEPDAYSPWAADPSTDGRELGRCQQPPHTTGERP